MKLCDCDIEMPNSYRRTLSGYSGLTCWYLAEFHHHQSALSFHKCESRNIVFISEYIEIKVEIFHKQSSFIQSLKVTD